MNFKEWKQWYKELPWTGKWFVILVLLRPIIDTFYKLKDVSPFLSPLNIVGVLTPVLVIASISSRKIPRNNKSSVANLFFIFGGFVVFNWVLLDILFPNIVVFGYSIKAMTPPILFLYLLRIIRSRRDLYGILNAFMYSGIYLLCLLTYEMIFGSIGGGHLTEGRGGGERLIGLYNDMMNYAIYIVGALLISGYFFLKNVYSVHKTKRYVLKFSTMIVICIFGLIGIKHVSTWVLCVMLFALLALFNLKNFKGFFVLLLFAAIFLLFFQDTIYKNQIEPLINKEINVASGDAELSGGLNGRIGRWEKYFDIWFPEIPFYSKMIGVPTSGHRYSFVMCGGGMHDDYVRNLFTAGVIGLLFYIIFLIMVAYRAMYFKLPERFLILGAVLALVVHSISTIPLAYSSYNYLLFSIMSFSLLPVKVAYRVFDPAVRKKANADKLPLNTRQVIPGIPPFSA